MKTKLFIFFTLFLMFTPVLLLAGGAKEKAVPVEEKIVLKFFTQEPGAYPTINTVVQKSFEAKHPNVRIDKQVVGYAQFQSTIASLLASGEAPDIIMAEPGGPYVSQVQAGAFLDLTPYLEAEGGKWAKEFYASALDLMRVDGKVYAIPVSLNNLQVMINRGLLEKYGLKEPQTVDELIGMVPKLKGTGVAPITFGFADKWSAVDLFVVFVWQQGAGDLLRKADYGKAKWTDPVFLKSMETIKKIADSGAAFEGATAMAWHEDALPNWVQGNSIMVWPGGNFMIQDIPTEMKADALWFPVMRDGKRILTGGVALALGASSTSKHKDLAVEFLKEFTTQESYKIIFENGVSPGGSLKVEAKSAYPLADKVNKQQGDAVDRRIYTPQLYDAIAVAVQGIFAGDITPKDAVAQIQKVSDEVYGK
jgi:raffinose/stachyose/melibiose transport system substrate-binding protein